MRGSVTLGGPLGIRVPEQPWQVKVPLTRSFFIGHLHEGLLLFPAELTAAQGLGWGSWRLILAVAFQTFSTGPADAFRKEITNSIVLKTAKMTILAVESCMTSNRLGVSALCLLSDPRQRQKFNWIPPVKTAPKMCCCCCFFFPPKRVNISVYPQGFLFL